LPAALYEGREGWVLAPYRVSLGGRQSDHTRTNQIRFKPIRSDLLSKQILLYQMRLLSKKRSGFIQSDSRSDWVKTKKISIIQAKNVIHSEIISSDQFIIQATKKIPPCRF
jgi:hypothetical protein